MSPRNPHSDEHADSRHSSILPLPGQKPPGNYYHDRQHYRWVLPAVNTLSFIYRLHCKYYTMDLLYLDCLDVRVILIVQFKLVYSHFVYHSIVWLYCNLSFLLIVSIWIVSILEMLRKKICPWTFLTTSFDGY